MADETEIPDLPEVARWQMRAGELRGKDEWTKRRLREVKEGLAVLIAHGRGDAPEADKLRDERRELQDTLDEIQAALPVLERQIEEARDQALREAARERLVGIARATGSLRHDYDKDGSRIEKAATEFIGAVRQANERYEKMLRLEAEGRALAERFDLRRGPQEETHPPARRKDLQEAVAIVERAGLRKKTLADQRLQAPAGSPGARLLKKAGPTEEQKETRAKVDARERERQRVEASLRAAQDRGTMPGRAPALGG